MNDMKENKKQNDTAGTLSDQRCDAIDKLLLNPKCFKMPKDILNLLKRDMKGENKLTNDKRTIGTYRKR